MNDQAIVEATGASLDQWADRIEEAGLGHASHKAIVDHLHRSHSVSYWWAQEITVEYEKRIGRRVVGQTQDGLFQVGVSKTLNAPAGAVWRYLESEAGRTALFGSASGGFAEVAALEGEDANGVRVKTTTYVPESHVRMQWQRPDWIDASILQIRVTKKASSKSTLSFHQEKLPSEVARHEMRERWRNVCAAIADGLG